MLSSSPNSTRRRRMRPRGSLSFASLNSEPTVAAVREAEEERRLAEQSRSDFYYKHTKLLKVLLVLSSIKLVAESKRPIPRQSTIGDGDQKPRRKIPALRNVLQPVAAWPKFRRPKDNRQGSSSWLGRLVWPPLAGLLIALFLHYAFVKLSSVSILSLERHLILSHLKPSVHFHAPKTKTCALREDLYYSQPTDWTEFERLKSLDGWLKFLGLNMTSLPEFSVSSVFTLAVIPIFYHHMCQLILSLHRFRVDTLCFMFNPLGERRRISSQLSNIVSGMIVSQTNHEVNNYGGLENLTVLHTSKLVGSSLRYVQRPRAQVSGLIRSSSQRQDYLAVGRRRQPNDERTRRFRYLKALTKMNKPLEYVSPYVVTSKWHENLLRHTDFCLKMPILSGIGTGAMIQLGIVLYDLCEATRLRLEVVECTKWRPQGGTRIATLDHLYLDELKSEEQLDAYKAHDGSTLSLLKLALLVESTSYFSIRRIICWLEILLVAYVYCFEAFLWSALHLASTAEKIAWLHQLEQQVSNVADQAAEHAHRARRLELTHEDDDRLLNTLTLAYLNYELFRRQYDKYLKLTDPITNCLTFVSIMSCLIIFFVGVSLGMSSAVLIFSFCLPLLACLNLFLLASAYRLKLLEKITIKASRVLAHCCCGSIKQSSPVELWRRQFCEESCQQYASRLFGIPVTYNTVLTLNGYAIALLLILLKPQLGSFR